MILPQIEVVGIYNSQKLGLDKISKKRRSTMFEIELPMENGGVSYIDSGSVPITPDMIICAKPGQTRHTKFPYKCYYVHMVLNDGYLYDTLMHIPDFFKTDKYEAYERIFQRLCKFYDTRTKRDEIIQQSLILELIHTLSQDLDVQILKNKTGGSGYQTVEKSLRYIKENLTEALSLENVARAMSLSPIHFHNLFKSSVGQTLRSYVEEQRIKKAIDLMLTTELTLTEIAYRCGFSSQSYFSYVFKRKMNTTPRKYVQDLYKQYGE